MCTACNNPELRPINTVFKTIEPGSDGTKKFEVTRKVYGHGVYSSPMNNQPGRWEEYIKVVDKRLVK